MRAWSAVSLLMYPLSAVIPAAVYAQPTSPGFIPGHIFASVNGSESCFTQRNWIYQIDPASGEQWIFADSADGLCVSNGLAFTPDGRRLRTSNLLSRTILDFDSAGNATVVYSQADGMTGPWGQNGLAWNRAGDFFVANEYGRYVMRFPAAGGPGLVLTDGYPDITGGGGLAITRGGDLYLAKNGIHRIPPSGPIVRFDRFTQPGYRQPNALAIDQRGRLFAGVVTQADGVNRVEVHVYDDLPSARRRLVSDQFPYIADYPAITLSPDESEVWVATLGGIFGVSVEGGPVRLVHADTIPLASYGRGLTEYVPPRPGDLNCDRRIDNFDIDAFVEAVVDADAFALHYPWCRRDLADLNGDGQVNEFDIDGFVAALVGAQQP
ncbi:MAG: hypothetical protein AB7Q17_06710 [Phycisphaerae bacterium]